MALDPPRLPSRVADAVEDTANSLWLSPLSIWEVVQLTGKGRLVLDAPLIEWTRRLVGGRNMSEAALTIQVALEASRFTLPHRDPIDRLLVATARAYELTFVTADRNLIAAGAVETLPNL